MELVKSIFDNAPKTVEREGKNIRINFDVDVAELPIDGTDNEELKRTAFSAYVVRVEQPLERDKVIDAIVSAAYPSDKMQAIINNHLVNLATLADGGKLDEDELAHEEEYKAMQEWRKKAKSVAGDVMEAYLSNI
nr:MAG TPA: hypothetical protein [Caudoviricetes sp.]DAH96235.1 MAG TPA: hypothetical protein [Caudoviricetes sp.]